MMDVFRNLFGGEPEPPPHPAMSWEPAATPLPVIDLAQGAVGSLRFGDPLENARGFGRPDDVSITGEWVSLSYASRGFELEFYQDRFDELRVIIAAPAGDPDRRSCVPTLSNGGQLTPAVTPEAIKAALGEPQYTDEDDEEVNFIYENDQFVNEFDFENGSLWQWTFSRNE